MSDAALPPKSTNPSSPPEIPATIVGGGTPLPVDVSPRPLRESEEEHRYEPRGYLGEGGMGEVRSLRDLRIGREVAQKTLKEDRMGDAAIAARFVREARVQAQLEHPAIVPVYDLGVEADGRCYFTMKRVRGRTLQDVIASLRAGDSETVRAFSRRKLLTAFGTVCLAVDFAHRRGVLHRDLKPANIMLGDFGEVYALDWGIARVGKSAETIDEGAAMPSRDGETRYGSALGTPGYMSPEQLRGEIDRLGPATDVYALGAILYEILALAPLHDEATVADLAVSTLAGADARVRARAPDADAPPELEAICVRATASEPRDRYESASAISEAVEKFLDGDRDLERRRELARTHTANAEELLRAGDRSEQDHARIMREIGRALAFDPTNVDARRILVELLTEPPRTIPKEARAEIERSQIDMERSAAWGGTFVYTGWLIYSVAFVIMGVRDGLAYGLYVACFGAALAACLAATRARQGGRYFLPIVIVANALGIAVSCTAFGPFIFAYAGAVGTTTAFMLYPRAWSRSITTLIGVASTALPALLQYLQIWPRSYEFQRGTMIVVPRMIELSEGETYLALTLGGAIALALGCFVFAQMRDALTRAETRLHLHAWQLRQLVADRDPG